MEVPPGGRADPTALVTDLPVTDGTAAGFDEAGSWGVAFRPVMPVALLRGAPLCRVGATGGGTLSGSGAG